MEMWPMTNKFNTISANSLFHFTSTLDKLVSILRNDFYPRYCPEDHTAFYTKQTKSLINYKRAIPMVCFCDIPLAQIRNHVKTYGHYAIGLSKVWGVKNKVSPVMYTTPNSNSTVCLRESFDYLSNKVIVTFLESSKFNANCVENKELAEIAGKLDSIIYYTKPYNGIVRREGKSPRRIRFYDEREWRYIPQRAVLNDKNIMLSVPNVDLLDVRVKDDANANIAKYCRLTFTPNDIKYIVVKKESEVLHMVNRITELKSPKYEPNDVSILKTRIISTERILEDF
jgi:hypothetical protein